MRRTALQTFFRGALAAAIPFGLGVAQATTPACDSTVIVSGSADDGGAITAGSDGGYTTADCNRICGGYGYWCEPAPADAGPRGSVACHVNRCSGSTCGRLTDGLQPSGEPVGGDVVARYFEAAAQLEAASVLAFDRLARELSAHGGPPSLVERALASARDEVRHARIVGRLAHAHGGRRPTVARAALPVRSLDEVAIENAVEGCVRETFGALVASWQALAAGAPRVRRAMRVLAVDEQRHAELAWSVARWAEPRLGATARRRLRAARRASVAELAKQIAIDPPPPLVRVVGLPPRSAARALFDEARRQLWRGAAA
jgi:hypothetical protein